jgi:hypothetical protein
MAAGIILTVGFIRSTALSYRGRMLASQLREWLEEVWSTNTLANAQRQLLSIGCQIHSETAAPML